MAPMTHERATTAPAAIGLRRLPTTPPASRPPATGADAIVSLAARRFQELPRRVFTIHERRRAGPGAAGGGGPGARAGGGRRGGGALGGAAGAPAPARARSTAFVNPPPPSWAG